MILHMPDSSVHGEAEAKRMKEEIGRASTMMFKVDDWQEEL